MPQGMQRLFVMRHGERVDEVDETWASTSDRPWDPPLTERGRGQARGVGESLRGQNITRVVCSPFTRCIQTAKEAAAELGVPYSNWLVDCKLGEVMDRRCLALREGEEQPPEGLRSLPARGWGESASLPAGVEDDIAISREGAPLPFPESLEAAHQRYSEALDRVAERYPGESVLVVTHGEAVSRSVTRVLPEVIVYETAHCGYTVAAREGEGDAGSSDSEDACEWHLETAPGETGVMWMGP